MRPFDDPQAELEDQLTIAYRAAGLNGNSLDYTVIDEQKLLVSRHLPRNTRVRIPDEPGTENHQINAPGVFTNNFLHRHLQPIMLGAVSGLHFNQGFPALFELGRLLFLAGVSYVLQRLDFFGRALDLLFPLVKPWRCEVGMHFMLTMWAMKINLRDRKAQLNPGYRPLLYERVHVTGLPTIRALD
jgi:hypothetical protein